MRSGYEVDDESNIYFGTRLTVMNQIFDIIYIHKVAGNDVTYLNHDDAALWITDWRHIEYT